MVGNKTNPFSNLAGSKRKQQSNFEHPEGFRLKCLKEYDILYVVLRVHPSENRIILDSSMVEHSAVNRVVAGSSPARGAVKSVSRSLRTFLLSGTFKMIRWGNFGYFTISWFYLDNQIRGIVKFH